MSTFGIPSSLEHEDVGFCKCFCAGSIDVLCILTNTNNWQRKMKLMFGRSSQLDITGDDELNESCHHFLKLGHSVRPRC